MKLAVLTSSRADYSIYFPLLKLLHSDPHFDLDLIVFGMHLLPAFGYTADSIKRDGFEIAHQIDTPLHFDSSLEVALSISQTMEKFSRFWSEHNYDLILCLGDRYEMFAAVCASVPFNCKIAHIHGGETTLGAIDNIYRHSITLMSSLHFTTTETYKQRVMQLINSSEGVYNVGALSIDNLKNIQFFSADEFESRFNINIRQPYILITIHPETVSAEKNLAYIDAFINALKEIKGYHFIITMPNADTMGNVIREKLKEFIISTDNTSGVETLGTVGYLTCMKHCSFMMGNTSSGFVEAAFFPKFVINLGDRQKGRILTENIINCEFEKNEILNAVRMVENAAALPTMEVYGNGRTAEKIVDLLRNIEC